MSEEDPGPLSTSKMELAVTIINATPPPPPYIPGYPYWPRDFRIYHLLPTLLLNQQCGFINYFELLTDM